MKGLDWPSERYVRFYCRDTASWMVLGWEAQALYPQIRRKCDRAGVLDLGDELKCEALAAVLPKWPPEMVERGLDQLISKGWIDYNEELNWLYIADFEDSESAKMTSAQRSRESRAKDAAERRIVASRDETSHEGEIINTGGSGDDGTNDSGDLRKDATPGPIVASRDETLQAGTKRPKKGRPGTRRDAAGRGGTRRDSVPSHPIPTHPNPPEAARAAGDDNGKPEKVPTAEFHGVGHLNFSAELLRVVPGFQEIWKESSRKRKLRRHIGLDGEQDQIDELALWAAKYGKDEVLAEIKRATLGRWKTICASEPQGQKKPKGAEWKVEAGEVGP